MTNAKWQIIYPMDEPNGNGTFQSTERGRILGAIDRLWYFAVQYGDEEFTVFFKDGESCEFRWAKHVNSWVTGDHRLLKEGSTLRADMRADCRVGCWD